MVPSKRVSRWLLPAALLCSMPAWAALRSEPMEWREGETSFRGVLIYDDASAQKRPGLLLFPNWMGVEEANLARAREIAGRDYVVLVADVYGRELRPSDKTEARAAVGEVYADGGATLRRRAAAALTALRGAAARAPLDAERIAALGFCFGGSVALELARAGGDLDGVVSFHGGLQTYLPKAERIAAPLLVLNGAADASVTREHVAAFEDEMHGAGADWQFVNFGGARHCFSQREDANAAPDDNCRYDARAAARAFAMMRGFLRERFATR